MAQQAQQTNMVGKYEQIAADFLETQEGRDCIAGDADVRELTDGAIAFWGLGLKQTKDGEDWEEDPSFDEAELIAAFAAVVSKR